MREKSGTSRESRTGNTDARDEAREREADRGCRWQSIRVTQRCGRGKGRDQGVLVSEGGK